MAQATPTIWAWARSANGPTLHLAAVGTTVRLTGAALLSEDGTFTACGDTATVADALAEKLVRERTAEPAPEAWAALCGFRVSVEATSLAVPGTHYCRRCVRLGDAQKGAHAAADRRAGMLQSIHEYHGKLSRYAPAGSTAREAFDADFQRLAGRSDEDLKAVLATANRLYDRFIGDVYAG